MTKEKAEATAVAVSPMGEVTNAAARKERVGQGSEQVTAQDLMLPRLKILQKLSPELDETTGSYIEGAKQGMIMNSVSGSLATSLYVVNLKFTRSTVVWRKRAAGAGIFGTFNDEAEAIAAIEEANQPVDQYDIVETPTHLVMILNDDAEPQGIALIDMPSSKGTCSRKWNTLISEQEQMGNPRFGCVWELSTVARTNKSGQGYHNFDVELAAVAGDEIYDVAAMTYDNFVAAHTPKAANA